MAMGRTGKKMKRRQGTRREVGGSQRRSPLSLLPVLFVCIRIRLQRRSLDRCIKRETSTRTTV